jgi:hypothetical protein
MKPFPTSTAPLVTASALVSVALALAAAACAGGGSTHRSASSPPPTSAGGAGPVAFSRCVRSHGLPNFPDLSTRKPTPQQLGVSEARFQTAVGACDHLLPNGGVSPETARQTRARLADELSFARCMRGRGVTRFPDPTAQGDLSVEMVQAQGIDVHSPAVLRVVQACLPASHGALTPAKVREALRNAGG